MFADIWLCVTVIIIIALYYMYTNRWPGEKLSAIYLLVEQTKNKIRQSYRLCNENMLFNKCETYCTEYIRIKA